MPTSNLPTASSAATTTTSTLTPPQVTLPAVPRGFVPVPAADSMGYRPMASEVAAAPDAVAELQVFTEYRAMLGIAAPDATLLARRLAVAAQWTSLLARSSAWTRYVQSQEGVAWKDALELLQKLKVPFRLATKAEPSLLVRYPALARLLRASSVVANRAAATRKRRKHAAAAALMTADEGATDTADGDPGVKDTVHGKDETGKVSSANLDCAGQCVGGCGDGRCRAELQRVTFAAPADAAGNLAIHNDNDGRDDVCSRTTTAFMPWLPSG